MSLASWTTSAPDARPKSPAGATRKLRLPRARGLQFAAATGSLTHTNAAPTCLASSVHSPAPSWPPSILPMQVVARSRSACLRGSSSADASSPMPACASKACRSTSPRRTEVHGRTRQGQTARHAAAPPPNRSFHAPDAVFPNTCGTAACCNHFVMSLSHLSSKELETMSPRPRQIALDRRGMPARSCVGRMP